MDDIKKLAKQVAGYVKGDKTKSYDTSATVTKVTDDAIYVHIPGGVAETPVKKTIDAKVGDTVQVHVGNGTAWLVGNQTAPPTDDAEALVAKAVAKVADQNATEAKTTADGAQVIATTASTKADEAETKADTALEQVGASITTDTLHYLATDQSSGVTINTQGWTTTVQSITSALPYLWTYHTYHKASGTSVNTQPVITGVYGETGATGAQGPAGQQGEQGPAGSDGDDGISVTAVQPQYYLSTSSSSATGGSWGNSLSYETGKYIWTRDQITYSNSTTGYSTAIYNQALTTACSTSEQALNVAEGVDEHFWYDNTGAHVTEDTQEDYQQDPANAGGNTLITSQGMAVRKGTKELATMSQDGFDAKSYDSGGNEVIITHLGYGPGTDSGGGTSKAPYYDIGVRKSGTTKGNYSLAEGYNTTASGYCSHAEGNGTVASGYESHAGGAGCQANGDSSFATGKETIAGYGFQTVIGEYNDNKSANVFEIGNGGSPTSRSNAFEVSKTGDITSTGKATLGAINGTALFDYTTVSMTSSSIAANASGEVTSSASTKSKYYPIAITNVNISTGQASLRRFYFSTQQSGKAVVKIGLQNDGTSAKTISVSADILWVKIAV